MSLWNPGCPECWDKICSCGYRERRAQELRDEAKNHRPLEPAKPIQYKVCKTFKELFEREKCDMDLVTYSQRAWATAAYPKDLHIGNVCMYPILGLGGETGELTEKWSGDDTGAIVKEIGDVFWYINALSRELDYPFEKLFARKLYNIDIQNCLNSLVITVGKIQEVFKKLVRDSGSVMSSEKRDILIEYLADCTNCLGACCDVCGTSVAEVLNANIVKLESRKARGTLGGSGDNR